MLQVMRKLLPSFALVLVSACSMDAGTEYTLYRTGIDFATKSHDETQRIHVATFDADQDAKYNRANCDFAQELLNASQPHYRGSIFQAIKIRYWCEKGRFRP